MICRRLLTSTFGLRRPLSTIPKIGKEAVNSYVESYKLRKEPTFFDKLQGYLVKKGKKSTATRVMRYMFEYLFLKTGLGKYSVLMKVYSEMSVYFEARRIRKSGGSHIVPVLVRRKRRKYLAAKWIFQAIERSKGKQKFDNCKGITLI
jgi:ribosomal protein S7